MSPDTDPHDAHRADSAGVPWEGRSFHANPHSGDDGSADPALLAALRAFRDGSGDQVAVVDAYRSARLLIPLLAEKGGIRRRPEDVVSNCRFGLLVVHRYDVMQIDLVVHRHRGTERCTKRRANEGGCLLRDLHEPPRLHKTLCFGR